LDNNTSQFDEPNDFLRVDAALDLLWNEDVCVRLEAAMLLRDRPSEADRTLEPLSITMLTDEDDNVRLYCSVALSEILRARGSSDDFLPDEASKRIVNLLRLGLHAPNDQVKEHSAFILSYFGGLATAATEELIQLGQGGERLTNAAIRALRSIMHPSETRATVLILRATKDSNVSTRALAYQALGQIHQVQSEDITQALKEGLADDVLFNRIDAAQAMIARGMVSSKVTDVLRYFASRPAEYHHYSHRAKEILADLEIDGKE
jgi:HEAT repeat protein